MRITLLRRVWVTVSAYVIGIYASLFNQFRSKGAENIPSNYGALLASNHISAYETVLLPWAVIRHRPFKMLWAPAKEELFKNRITGTLYSSWGAFPVTRGRDVKAGKKINDLLIDQKVMIFPEGTRHKDGVLGKGNRGVGKIIYDVKPIVIPTALIGLNHWKFPRFFQKASVIFGPPIDFSDLFLLEDTKTTHQLIVDRVMDSIADLLKKENAYVT